MMIQKKYVIDCVTSKFVLERNCTEKTKRSGEVVGEKEKKGGPKCTRGTSYLRRKLTQLSHNANNTSLVSISHTGRSPLNNILFWYQSFYTYSLIFANILQPNPIFSWTESASFDGLQFFGPLQHFSGPSPPPPIAYSRSKSRRKKKTKECRKQDLNLQLSSRDEGGLPLHINSFVTSTSTSLYL